MSIDLPRRPRDWTGIHDQKLVRHFECHLTIGRSAIPDGNPTPYLPLDFRKSQMIQRTAGNPAPGQDRLRIQKPSASRADVIAAIRLEALIQTACYVLGRPEDLLFLPAPHDFPPRYSAWVRRYCDTHYLHFLNDHAWSNPLADPDSACTYPSRLPGQQQLGRRSKEVDDFSRRHMYLPFTDNDEIVSLGKPAALSAKFSSLEQYQTSSSEGNAFKAFSECSDRQENKSSLVFSAVCSLQGICNVILSISEAVQNLHTKQRSVDAMGGVVESEGIEPVNIILPYLTTAARDGEVETERTGTSSAQGQNDHGRSVQKQQRNATWPLVAGKKRPADSEDFSDGDDDDNKRPRKKITRLGDPPKLACPYYKYNPHRFGSERSCSGPGWPDMKRLKEHLFRRHKAPDHQCPRCLTEFEDNQSKMQHCQAQETCNVGQSTSTTGFLDENKMRLLKQRGRISASESEKWNSMYKILFPNEASLPSPYYEEREKRPEPPPRAFAQEMFREKLDEVLSRWGLVEPPSMMGMHGLQVMELMRSGALTAFDETLSALYNQRMEFPLDNRIPAIAASGLEETYDEGWLRPWMPLDTTGKDSHQAHKLDEVSECALTRCSGSDLNTEPWKLDMVEGPSLQIPNRKALTASVSNSDGRTIDTSFWPLPLQNTPAEPFASKLQQQGKQQRESRILYELQRRKLAQTAYPCSACGHRFSRRDDLLNHQLRSCRLGRPKHESIPTSALTSCQRQGCPDFNITPPTPVETPEEGNGRVAFDCGLSVYKGIDGDELFEILDNDLIGDPPKIESKGKDVDRAARLSDIDIPNHEMPPERCGYEQPSALNPWHSGLGDIWSPNHQNGSLQTTTDDVGGEDTVVSAYQRGIHHYGT